MKFTPSCPIPCTPFIPVRDMDRITSEPVKVKSVYVSASAKRKSPKSLKFHHLLELGGKRGKKFHRKNLKIKSKGKLCFLLEVTSGPSTAVSKPDPLSSESVSHVPLSYNDIFHGY